LLASTHNKFEHLDSTVRCSDSDADPTRENILAALYSHLRDNDDVRSGDNLLFHFSGHGASYPGPSGSAPSRTEALCPADRSVSGNVIDISDRELNMAFAEISRNKGSNFTVILDCCHSGGLTRSTDLNRPEERRRQARSLPGVGAPQLFASAINDPRRQPQSSQGPSPLSRKWTSNCDSHVLLAACKSWETAKETETTLGGNYVHFGAFTHALISALKSPRGHQRDVTYATLIKDVLQHPPHGQTPVVSGNRMNSRLWFPAAEDGIHA
jgi:hypothetical protein